MSYWDPSSEEAYNEYYYNKRKYEQAYAQKKSLDRQKDNITYQQSWQKNNINNLKNDKLNFEKRLKGLEDIISKLESGGGLFSKSVPEAISDTERPLTDTVESYRQSITSNGIKQGDIYSSFKVKSVTAHYASNNALNIYKRKYNELQTAIVNVNRSIDAAEEEIKNLTNRINDINDMQRQLNYNMNNYSQNMNHYRKYI